MASTKKSNIIQKEENNELEHKEKLKKLNVIMFVAIPGSGKSFVARVMKYLLEASGKKVTWIEQDMFYQSNNASIAYDGAIKKAVKDSNIQYLILSKSNHNVQVRTKTDTILEASGRNICKTYVVMTANDGDMNATYKICIKRIMDRGYAHNSLYGKTKNELEGIIRGTFLNQYQELTLVEASCGVIKLDINQSKDNVVESCITQLNYIGVVSKEDIATSLLSISSIFEKIAEEDSLMIVSNNLRKLEVDFKNSDKVKNDDNIKLNNSKKINEKKVTNKNLSILYDSLIVNSGELLSRLDFIPWAGLQKKKEFHVTLKYYGGISINNNLVIAMEDNEPHVITVVGYAVDENALALRVFHSEKLSNRFANEYGHITFALRSGVKPIYSSTLIEKALKRNNLIAIEPFKLVGYTKRHFASRH